MKLWDRDPDFRPAPVTSRLAAALIDYSLLFVIYRIIMLRAQLLTMPIAFALVVNLMIYFTYFVALARLKMGTTPGKFLFGLYVVDDELGRPLTYHRTVARAFYKLLPFVPFFCYFYIYYPYMLSDLYEFRQGSLKLWQKIQSGQSLSPSENQRWQNFQLYVQAPINHMAWLAIRAMNIAILGCVLLLVLHPRRQTVHDIICQTIVIKQKRQNPFA